MGSCHLNWRLLVRVTAYVHLVNLTTTNNTKTQKDFIQIKIKCAVSKKENVTVHNQNATEVFEFILRVSYWPMFQYWHTAPSYCAVYIVASYVVVFNLKNWGKNDYFSTTGNVPWQQWNMYIYQIHCLKKKKKAFPWTHVDDILFFWYISELEFSLIFLRDGITVFVVIIHTFYWNALICLAPF